jgi:hypothetical protein
MDIVPTVASANSAGREEKEAQMRGSKASTPHTRRPLEGRAI